MDTELIVIGGGPAGYTAAIRGAQRGLEVTLVEDGNVGGTCLNHGCIPSKALLTATETVRNMETAEQMGIYVEPYVDVREMVEWKDGIVDRLTTGVEQLCRENGVEVVDGFARFEDTNTVTVDGDESISFEYALIATGSHATTLPNFDFNTDVIMNARQALAVEQVPPRLLVVGAGYIGMELSTVFARLGSDVTIVEMLDEPLPQFDEDLARPVHEAASGLGIDFHYGEAAKQWQEEEQGITVTTESKDGETAEYEIDRVLVAVGREPVTSGLNLDAISVETDGQGFIETDSVGQTASEHIFAIGDVAGEPMLAHAGSYEGIVAVETIAGEDPPSASSIPTVVFTEPEIATVGRSPAEAREEGFDPTVGEFPFSASGRAMTTRQTNGFVRLVADIDGRVIGGQIVGPEASELIAEVGLAIQANMTLSEFAETVHTHPTLSEATMEAAEHALGQAIHTLNQ